ncbi:MAG: TRIC cation channel family protein [Anaerolineae bacterium]|nr:TRIC cation channel family protein [Anaerolineae bacterium]
MYITPFSVPIFLDVIAVLLWALSGAIVATRRGFDLVGVFAIAVVASTGGSIIRDGLFLQRTPPVVTNPAYLPAILIVSLGVIPFSHLIHRWRFLDQGVGIIDAIGTPAFTVLGTGLALAAGTTVPGAMLIGALNGIGGGILRDMLVGDTPEVFRPGQFNALVAVLASGLYILLLQVLGASDALAAWLTVGAYFLTRVLTIRYNWHTVAMQDVDYPAIPDKYLPRRIFPRRKDDS